MNPLHQSFSVRFEYAVFFTERLFSPANPLFTDFLTTRRTSGLRPKLLFVLDAGVVAHHPTLPADIRALFADNAVAQLADVVEIPGGEAAKNDPALVGRLIDAIDRHGIDRHSYVVGVGGGSVLDLVGYVAAIAHRGIRHIRVPGTVLAQNDSGVGVKNGINYRGKKNFLGTFAPPVAVFNDAHLLTTLSDRDWRAGTAEAVKVALIKDAAFFDWLDAQAGALARRDGAAMQYLIHRCAELHLQHIAGGDPFETGSARPLDFGHWSAHKLEQLTNFSLRHGEAVAIGMALDSLYSEQLGWLSARDSARILRVLQTLGFALYDPALTANNSADVLRGLTDFREHLGGQLTITLLRRIGQGVEVHDMDVVGIRRAIERLRQYDLPSENELVTDATTPPAGAGSL